MNSVKIYFNDNGELTNSKLLDFRNQLRPVGRDHKTAKLAIPILSPPLGKVSPNKNRPLPPLPPPPVVQAVIIDTKPKSEDENFEIKKEVTENPKEKISNTRIIEKILLDKPGFFKRTAKGISKFAKIAFAEIKFFLESVFGKLFGRVTKIKIDGKEITFDGHDPKNKLKNEKTASFSVDLDPQAATILKGVVVLGGIAADHLPPPPPPLPSDGIPVKNWRQKVQKNDVQEEQTEQVNIKELVEKKRREHQGQGVFGLLAKGLANWRESRHLGEYSDDDEDSEPFFQVTFIEDDGKKTNLTFNGEKTVEITTEVQDLQPREYSGLRKRRDGSGEGQPINTDTLAAARSDLNKAEPRAKQTIQGKQSALGNVLLGSIMKNAAHLLR